jgi:dihydrofolate reductase
MSGRARVFIACSLDGFIAGPGDDLSWLPPPPVDADGKPVSDFGYAAFMAEVGALLMGRNTYEVVAGFGGEWPYGAKPVLVATTRPLAPVSPTVRAVTGDAATLLAAAREAAGDRDVYVDGGVLIRQLLAAGLIDEMIVSIIPIVLGAGAPLFAGLPERCALECLRAEHLPGGLVQVTYRPVSRA